MIFHPGTGPRREEYRPPEEQPRSRPRSQVGARSPGKLHQAAKVRTFDDEITDQRQNQSGRGRIRAGELRQRHQRAARRRREFSACRRWDPLQISRREMPRPGRRRPISVVARPPWASHGSKQRVEKGRTPRRWAGIEIATRPEETPAREDENAMPRRIEGVWLRVMLIRDEGPAFILKVGDADRGALPLSTGTQRDEGSG